MLGYKHKGGRRISGGFRNEKVLALVPFVRFIKGKIHKSKVMYFAIDIKSLWPCCYLAFFHQFKSGYFSSIVSSLFSMIIELKMSPNIP